MNDNEKGGGTDDDNYKISPRDFFVPTQVMCTFIHQYMLDILLKDSYN